MVARRSSMFMRGFDDTFMVPHSRHTTIRREEVEACGELKILASSPKVGIYALSSEGGRQIFITGHSEYNAGTLQKECLRDKNAGLPSHANLLYQNRLNYFVYQATPYDPAPSASFPFLFWHPPGPAHRPAAGRSTAPTALTGSGLPAAPGTSSGLRETPPQLSRSSIRTHSSTSSARPSLCAPRFFALIKSSFQYADLPHSHLSAS